MNGETPNEVSQNTNVVPGMPNVSGAIQNAANAAGVPNPVAAMPADTGATGITSNTVVVDTAVGEHNGENICPKCGSTEVIYSQKAGKLICQYCRFQFEPEKVEGFATDLSNLNGTVIGSGANDIIASESDILTLKCQYCGAEVVIDTASSTNARCHWCRNTLTIQEKVPNGAVPDVVLPFAISKEEAQKSIETFVKKRKFFANTKFKKEFTTNNIMGVYFPYMVVDANMHSKLNGVAEVETRRYTETHGDRTYTYYDADAYTVSREYDLTLSGLSVESSKDRLNNASQEKTNNVINAIMPFDTENAVKWNANYIKGYTSEKRDANIGDLSSLVKTQAEDISRFAANETLTNYDRGVAWSSENHDIKGSQWKAAYLPVWLYSYMQIKGNKKLLHYVAVNARTKETMGSVPINKPKLLLLSFIFEILCVFIMIGIGEDWSYLFLLGGPIFYLIFYNRYRNQSARHTYETETKHNMSGLIKSDLFYEHRKKLDSSQISGCNNTKVHGTTGSTKFLDQINGKQVSAKTFETLTNGNAVASYIKGKIDKKK